MNRITGRIALRLAAVMLAAFSLSSTLVAQLGWETRGLNNNRNGWNPNELVLNQGNVNIGQFGLLFTRPVDGQIYAQPLVVPNVKIPGQGTLDVVYVATQHDSVFAFDADNPANSTPLWQRSFINPANGVTTVPYYDLTQYTDINPEVGITSTPAIDPVGGTLYVVVKTLEGDPNNDASYVQRLWALDLATGAPKLGSPVVLAASVPGTGAGSSGGVVSYSGRRENQRPALVLNGGKLYIVSASHGDNAPYHGWVLSYDATTLKQLACFCTSPNGYDGGIWMSGQGLPIDGSGYVYLATGNGDFNPATNDWGDSLLKLNGTSLAIKDYFTPYNQANLDAYDVDLGVCGPVLIPGTGLLVQGSKEGKLYLVNSQNMGKFDAAGDNQIVQWWWACSSEIFGPPVYFSGGPGSTNLYVWSGYDVLKGFSFNGTTFNTTPFATGAPYVDGPGGMLTVSSQGTVPISAIVWATTPYNGDAGHSTQPGVLHAFSAQTLTELWNSKMVAGDDFGDFAKFNPPVVINSKVYVATFSNQLAVYGALPRVQPNPPGITAEAGNRQVAVTWQAAHGSSGYTIWRGPVGGPYTQVSAVTGGSGIYVDTGLTNGTTYAYRVIAQNAYGQSVWSNEASDTPVSMSSGTGTGLTGYYYNDPGDGTHFRTLAMHRLDPTINFNWNGASPGGAVGGVNFSTTWYGSIVAPTTGYYTFETDSDDGSRLWVRGQLAVNDWVDQGQTPAYSAPILLVAGKSYPIQLEYYQHTGGSACQLEWEAPGSSSFVLIPASAMYPYPAALPTYDAALDMGANYTLDGMSYLTNPTTGNIGYEQESFAAELMPRFSTFSTPANIPFIIGPGYPGALNIVECDGQTILTPAYTASEVYLLGCAINGSQEGTFTFNYSDGTSSMESVTFTDWNSATPKNKETLAENFKLRHNPQGNVVTPTSIFKYQVAVTDTKHLISITLPDNPNMKILSVSVHR